MAAFAAGNGPGLLALAQASSNQVDNTPSYAYWTAFACGFLREFCCPDTDPSPPMPQQLGQQLLNSMPTIQGSDQLQLEVLQRLWQDLSSHLSEQVAATPGGKRRYLERHLPEWVDVGRVHFHLAEQQQHDQVRFVFLATYTTRQPGKTRVQHVPLGQLIHSDSIGAQKITAIFAPVREAGERSLCIHDLITSKRIFAASPLSNSETLALLQDSELFEALGIRMKLPRAWKDRPAKAKVSVSVAPAEPSRVGFHAMFSCTARVTIDGEAVGGSELQHLLNSMEELVQIRGRWVQVNGPQLRSLLSKWHHAQGLTRQGLTFAQAMRLLSGSAPGTVLPEEEETVTGGSWLEFQASVGVAKNLEAMTSPDSIRDTAVGEALHRELRATLRPYQLEGVQWLSFLSKLGLGGCLADDMGLGKTIQIISLLIIEKARAQGSNLLVVPASLLGNWEQELRKFAPNLRFEILHRSSTDAKSMQEAMHRVAKRDLMITTYAMVSRLAWLTDVEWNLVVVDEAQAIKSPDTAQTKSIKSLKGRCRFALTGTPVENGATDLWSILDFCCPTLLGQQKQFQAFYDQLNEKSDFSPLRRLVRPYILRRKKTDRRIITDLPDKIEKTCYCELSVKQITLYRRLIKKMAADLEADLPPIQRRGLVLSYLLRFKQLCNHPSQMLGDDDYRLEDSGKFLSVQRIARHIAAQGERLLVFTQYREITDILDGLLRGVFAADGFVLHGSTPVAQRRRMVDLFQRDERFPYFVLSLKAGGTGLNLTGASHVIHLDRWWNPAVEDQATDRAFRIGQRQNVLVHKMVCRGTIEERIAQLIHDKRTLADQLVEGGDQLRFTDMSNEQLLELVQLSLDDV